MKKQIIIQFIVFIVVIFVMKSLYNLIMSEPIAIVYNLCSALFLSAVVIPINAYIQKRKQQKK